MSNAVAHILEKVGARSEIALSCEVEEIAVYRWCKSGRIPSRHLAGIMEVAKKNGSSVTAAQLINALSPSLASRSEAG